MPSYVSRHAEQRFVAGTGPDPWSREPVALRDSMAMYDALLQSEAEGRTAFRLWWAEQRAQWEAAKANPCPDIPWEVQP